MTKLIILSFFAIILCSCENFRLTNEERELIRGIVESELDTKEEKTNEVIESGFGTGFTGEFE